MPEFSNPSKILKVKRGIIAGNSYQCLNTYLSPCFDFIALFEKSTASIITTRKSKTYTILNCMLVKENKY
jgi:hypothetical protein